MTIVTSLLSTQTDARLARLTAEGHDRAFETLVERHRAPLARYLRRMLAPALADDVLQATFVRAWQALRRGTEVRDVQPWLYRIAHNQAVNALRAAAVEPVLPDAPSAPGADVELHRREELRSTLDDIRALPERQRAALVAVAVEDRSHNDVARELGLSDGGLRQLLLRARSTLRAAATALTPPPLANWLAAGADSTGGRIAEMAVGAGGLGVVAKVGAAVLVTGAIVGGTTVVGHEVVQATTTPVVPAREAARTSTGPGAHATAARTAAARPAAASRGDSAASTRGPAGATTVTAGPVMLPTGSLGRATTSSPHVRGAQARHTPPVTATAPGHVDAAGVGPPPSLPPAAGEPATDPAAQTPSATASNGTKTAGESKNAPKGKPTTTTTAPKTPAAPKASPGQAKQPAGQAKQPAGQAKQPPAEANQPPGQAKVPPGQAKVPPGQAKEPPGQAKEPPGQAKEPPGQAKQQAKSSPPTADGGAQAGSGSSLDAGTDSVPQP